MTACNEFGALVSATRHSTNIGELVSAEAQLNAATAGTTELALGTGASPKPTRTHHVQAVQSTQRPVVALRRCYAVVGRHDRSDCTGTQLVGACPLLDCLQNVHEKPHVPPQILGPSLNLAVSRILIQLDMLTAKNRPFNGSPASAAAAYSYGLVQPVVGADLWQSASIQWLQASA